MGVTLNLLSGYFCAKRYSIGTILFVKSIVIGKCSEAGAETDDGAEKSGQKEWRYCLRAYRNWFVEITNSFDCPWNNGYAEGMHNKIKTVKRVASEMRNFHHFRTKILLVCAKDE